tara:strand:- start:9677 stop:9982 length:306 start_codon:yes stop_codon:yes gene_type:complete
MTTLKAKYENQIEDFYKKGSTSEDRPYYIQLTNKKVDGKKTYWFQIMNRYDVEESIFEADSSTVNGGILRAMDDCDIMNESYFESYHEDRLWLIDNDKSFS